MPSLTLWTAVRGNLPATLLPTVPVDAVACTVTPVHLASKDRQAYAAPLMRSWRPTRFRVPRERTTLQKHRITAWSTCI